QERARQREENNDKTIDRDSAEDDLADMPARRTVRQDDGGNQRAHARRSAQQAEPPRTDMEHVAGEHRQQRIDATEEHGEQVERNDAEDHRIMTDGAEAREQDREAQRLAQ